MQTSMYKGMGCGGVCNWGFMPALQLSFRCGLHLSSRPHRGGQALCGRGRRGSAVQEHDDSPEEAMVRGVVWGKHFHSDDRPESQNHDLACRWRTGPSTAGQSRDERPCYPHRTNITTEWFCWGGDINSATLVSVHARRLWGKRLRKPTNQGDVLTCGKLCENESTEPDFSKRRPQYL